VKRFHFKKFTGATKQDPSFYSWAAALNVTVGEIQIDGRMT
jgi:hypothetical protein